MVAQDAVLRRTVMSVPHLFTSWEKVRRQIAAADRVVLLSDFDGTLAPLRNRPAYVRMPVGLRNLLNQLSQGDVSVGIISGRSIDDVREKVGLEGIWYAGSHGYFLQDPRGESICLMKRKTESRMKALSVFLRLRLRRYPGLEVESKGATVAIHYRRATKQETAVAEQVLGEAFARWKDVRLMKGKKVWEILPGGEIDKWKSVQMIVDRECQRSRNSLVMYLGDDVTDETVFRKIRGLSVCIGKTRGTAASFHLKSYREVSEFLKRCEHVLCKGTITKRQKGSTGEAMNGGVAG